MECEDAALPFAGVDVGVDFGGDYALVSEHLLDGPQVGSVLDQMCGEGVAEGVGRYLLGDAGLFALAFDHQEYHLAARAGSGKGCPRLFLTRMRVLSARDTAGRPALPALLWAQVSVCRLYLLPV